MPTAIDIMLPVSILGFGLDDPKIVVRSSVGARDFYIKPPDRLWGPLSFLFKGTGVVSRECIGWSMKLTTHLYLVPPLHAFIAWKGRDLQF